MSVLSCSRKDCISIMCDKYSSDFGYLCHECFIELCAKGKVGHDAIDTFMNSSKKYYEQDTNAYFSLIFKED